MIHYFMTWGENRLGRQLAFSPAGLNKAKYILSKLQKVDYVTVASFASGGLDYNGVYFPKKTFFSNTPFYYCATFGSKKVYLRLVERIFNLFQMYVYILFSTKKQDILVFYNERYYINPIRFAHNILNRKVIIEVEEINTIAANYSKNEVKKEIDGQKNADGYILVNHVLKEYLPFSVEKPNCVIHGAYNCVESISEKYSDGKIHILYSGTFNQIKGGAIASIKLASKLNDNYTIHITGFGNKEEVSIVKETLDSLAPDERKRIAYHGFISNDELDDLMLKCHIGLCSQNPTTELNLTSFPSKIINYMSHGLVVLSGHNKAIETSDVGDLILYYDEQTPESIAKAILGVKQFDGQKCIDRLRELNSKTEINIASICNIISN